MKRIRKEDMKEFFKKSKEFLREKKERRAEKKAA